MHLGGLVRITAVTMLSAALIVDSTVPAGAAGGPVVLVSASSSGLYGGGSSYGTSMSADGRYVVFESAASDLVPADTNNVYDVFVRDRRRGTTERVNLSSTGEQADNENVNYGSSGSGSISADGRYVAFSSRADNLVPQATYGASAVFVRDRWASTTRLVSVSDSGQPASADSFDPMISGDGRYVVFASGAGNLTPDDNDTLIDIFRYDLRTSTIQRAAAASSPADIDGIGPRPFVSGDGRYVAFTSDATTLTPGDTNGVCDVFVHDFRTGTTRLVSRADSGGQTTQGSYAGAISADGRYVVFASDDSTLVRRDTNQNTDVFVYDLRTRTTRFASVSSTGVQGDGPSYAWMTISGDGRYVGFGSAAGNLVPGDTNGFLDVFVRDRRTATTLRLSVPNQGGEADGESFAPVLSADGRQVAFTSLASNLLGELGGNQQVYALPMPLG